MNDPLQNRINMIGTCIATAQSTEHRPAWEGKAPLDFATDLATLVTLHSAALGTAQVVATATGGSADAKASAETALENLAHPFSRACYNHFKKTGDMENCGKVNFTRTAIVRLRDQDLVITSRVIRDCGQIAVTHPDAGKRGITAEKITALSAAIDAFEALVNAPRTKIADRAVLNRELVTQVAGCTAHLEDMDDLVLQFAGTPEGDHFAAAWKQARIIVDAGGGQGGEEEQPPTPPTP